jgi:hypothetical protein
VDGTIPPVANDKGVVASGSDPTIVVVSSGVPVVGSGGVLGASP